MHNGAARQETRPGNGGRQWEGQSRDMAEGALAGLRLIAIGGGPAAAACAQLLADHGCEVIQLVLPPPLAPPDQAVSAATAVRGASSVSIDFQQPAGIALVQALLAKADFLLLGAPPIPALAATDPGLIRIELGNVAGNAAGDATGDAAVGAGLSAAFGAAIALQHRQRSGEGQCVQVPVGAAPAAVRPQLALTPGAVRWPPPAPGAHTTPVLKSLLGLSARDISRLRRAGLV